MKRRPKRRTVQEDQRTGLTLVRIPIEAVCGGVIRKRAEHDAQLSVLAASIARQGLLQPVVVRRCEGAVRYALVCGTRRLAACRMLGHQEIDAVVLDADEAKAAACFMEEHLTHLPPHPLDEAQAIERIGEGAVTESLSLESDCIAMRMALLALPEETARLARDRGLTLEQMTPLLSVPQLQRQLEAAYIIAERALTAAQARRLVFGPGRDHCPQGKRRLVASAMEEAARIAQRARARGARASVGFASQEDGVCIQIRLSIGEKRTGQQDFAKKKRIDQV